MCNLTRLRASFGSQLGSESSSRTHKVRKVK